MRVLISYEYFLPAYKAGGPVQSINNTAKMLSGIDGVETYILCSNKDLDGTTSDVVTDRWVEFTSGIHVYYCSITPDKATVNKIITELNPSVIFINGLYSLPYTVYPLMSKVGRKVLSLRGMLHPGALSQKPLKKKIFLTAFKTMGLHKKCEYHATTEEEVGYVKQVFGKNKKVWMVPNLPNVLNAQPAIEKEQGVLKLISVSLISPMKNILLVIQALKSCKSNITYDIYGPVKDPVYWEDCLEEIKDMPDNITVNYKGEVQPHIVQDILKDYHFFILPSKSENFGHAIYEALSAGRPVITSLNTPWNGLEEAGAGYNVDPENKQALVSVLERAAQLKNEDYKLSVVNARSYIERQYDLETINTQYKHMFAV